MGADNDDYYSMGYVERPGKKPSLHSRLQSGEFWTNKNIALVIGI